jgi:hypothetical protein
MDCVGSLLHYEFDSGLDYYYRAGHVPILLVARYDTGLQRCPKRNEIDEQDGILLSDNPIIRLGVERVGCYIVDAISERINCSVLLYNKSKSGDLNWYNDFCVDREIDIEAILEFDQQGPDQAVFCDTDNSVFCGTDDFSHFVCRKYYRRSAVISLGENLALHLNKSMVKLSCGFYFKRFVDEHIDLLEVDIAVKLGMNLVRRIVSKVRSRNVTFRN